MPSAPCKHCTPETGRSPTCHCTCQAYLDFAAKREEFREQRYREVMLRNHCGAVRAKAVQKTTRKNCLGSRYWA